MLLHNPPNFGIYFGGVKDDLHPEEYLSLPPQTNLLEYPLFTHLKKTMRLDDLVFLRQTHGIQGRVVAKDNFKSIVPFKGEGDYLMTQMQHVGLGVMTADCLPVVFYDTRHNAIAIAHAGWKGSAAGIAKTVFEQMQKEFGTQLDYIKIFFGPSAKSCCYEVNAVFAKELEAYPFAQEVFIEQGNKLFFDLPKFNRLLLESIGVRKGSFRFQYNLCTICDETFFSHRRQGTSSGRQMTVVSLK